MDALYLLRNSVHDDLEIRYSLRSLERHAPHVGKVWVFGDRPAFLTDDTTVAEHVPHAATGSGIVTRLPVTNSFLLIYLASLIPGLSEEFLCFSDDFVLLQDFPAVSARKVRYLSDLSQTQVRGGGRWRRMLWRTYDVLRILGYSGYNFATHTPAYLTRTWVQAAYRDLALYAHQDRLRGLSGLTAILNHVHTRHALPLVRIADEASRCGFWGAAPARQQVETAVAGKTFLNFDDPAFVPGIQSFLAGRFPTLSRYEKRPC